MSTQAARSILFTHTSPQQGFKLLELPPELADSLTSNDPPTLQLKSLSTDASQRATTNPEAREYVNLCTPTKTYRVRQVHSSNSIHVIRPSDGGAERGDINIVGGETDELNLVESMTSIAKCGSTLELHTPAEGFSAVPILEKMLGVYDEVDDDKDMVEAIEPVEENGVIQRVFVDVPVSQAQCETGWIELCAFVLGRGTGDAVALCRRPSAKVKLDVWKRVLEGAVLQAIELEKQFLVPDLWKSVLDDGEEPFPRPLFEAVVRRVCEMGGGQLFAEGGLKWASIDKESCMRWVGETYLEAMAPTSASAIGRSEFLNAWKDLLPETWRNEVAFSKLTENSYNHPDPTTICFVNGVDRQKIKKNVSTDASAATAAKKTRNWHELFKNQKRQKR